jgi:hypothetical protein
MDEQMVEQRFKAIANFGQELGIAMCKTPVVESIALLIRDLEVTNPLVAKSKTTSGVTTTTPTSA